VPSPSYVRPAEPGVLVVEGAAGPGSERARAGRPPRQCGFHGRGSAMDRCRCIRCPPPFKTVAVVRAVSWVGPTAASWVGPTAAESVFGAKSAVRGGSLHAAVTLRQECLGVSDAPDPAIWAATGSSAPISSGAQNRSFCRAASRRPGSHPGWGRIWVRIDHVPVRCWVAGSAGPPAAHRDRPADGSGGSGVWWTVGSRWRLGVAGQCGQRALPGWPGTEL